MHISWVTPANSLITPHYLSSQASRYSISINRRSFKMIYYKTLYKIDKSAMKSSIIPNIVHSLDAAHLFKTVANFDYDIMTIHDCFCVHPNNSNKLRKELKLAFVDMYFTNNW
jgi:DNA-directed RNA polymerase